MPSLNNPNKIKHTHKRHKARPSAAKAQRARQAIANGATVIERNSSKGPALAVTDQILHGRIDSKKTLKKKVRAGKYALQRLKAAGITLGEDGEMIVDEEEAVEQTKKGKKVLVQKDEEMEIESSGMGTELGGPPQ
ncbi:hypothetical protein SAICODRAFT_211317 [Saitoella complicata NRRL Y-17804]|uniref:Uncharacterized protein n=1 Tax=Saitoella complicata (strain BCRC 22490 / CBS 7301 / JCM 7358 / NBRC 10748 / NRRL Y-17804) TaxID=698492 RepID=A0A0E9N963_SAICN|nr:uncharacterized protein SAICODRAFT_211317 [Saitoella complicata NRRL Y-17804]ODQ54481.1 hypothetical protein SAICODRAFT_211317 [Saitoella complicata NRRL Y-17804]GAO45935.1 hypothetical protein G7K_0180-t1 [Saitoella complicata NRRL Y-17804]